MFNARFVRNPAFWIAPSGHCLSVRTTHITVVIENSRHFGLRRDQIVQIYKLLKEPVGSELRAREKIIRALVVKGWIRVRWYERSVTLNLPSLEERELLRACAFIRKAWGEHPYDFTPARLVATADTRTCEVADLQSGKILKGGAVPEKGLPRTVIVKCATDIPVTEVPQIDLLSGLQI